MAVGVQRPGVARSIARRGARPLAPCPCRARCGINAGKSPKPGSWRPIISSPPWTMVRRLLKSCATPPVSCPTASSLLRSGEALPPPSCGRASRLSNPVCALADGLFQRFGEIAKLNAGALAFGHVGAHADDTYEAFRRHRRKMILRSSIQRISPSIGRMIRNSTSASRCFDANALVMTSWYSGEHPLERRIRANFRRSARLGSIRGST